MKKMRKIIVLSLILVIVILAGCSNGATGNAVSGNAIDSDFGYASGSDAPQKKVKMTGTGHERVCY